MRPAFALLRRRLQDYAPEDASAICGVNPEAIRELARKAARRRTMILLGWTLGKAYHGDLMERAICLLLALTGNWGKHGAGVRSWAVGMFDGQYILGSKPRAGQEATQELVDGQNAMMNTFLSQDPTLTEEILVAELSYQGAFPLHFTPSAFFWYHHCGYAEAWNTASWNDPSMKRSFDDYVREAVEKGWWTGMEQPPPDTPPRVLFEIGGNLLRRQRGGQRMLLENLWPKLDLIVSVDWRMTTTGLHSDIVLPAAQHYEKPNFPYTTPDVMNLTLSDRAVEPAGEARSEWQIDTDARQEARRASQGARPGGDRQRKGRDDSAGYPLRGHQLRRRAGGRRRRHRRDGPRLGPDGQHSAGHHAGNAARDRHRAFHGPGSLSDGPGTGLGHLPERDPHPLPLADGEEGALPHAHAPRPVLHRPRVVPGGGRGATRTQGDARPGRRPSPSRSPAVTRAGASTPCAAPATSSWARIRGEPVAHINDRDAAARGIENGQYIRIFNDVGLGARAGQGDAGGAARPAAHVQRLGALSVQGLVQDLSNVEPGHGQVAPLRGRLRASQLSAALWQPIPADRAVRVDVEKVG